MEGIEKLREWTEEYFMHGSTTWKDLVELADEIEREIETSYMRLPVDADGAPCKTGEKLRYEGGEYEVMAVDEDCVWFDTDANDVKCEPFDARDCRHVKPDPIKELLEEFATDLENYKRDGVDFDCFAERIREAVGA